MVRTTNGFARMNLADFTTMLINIAGKMNGNRNFPTLQEEVRELESKKNEYIILAEKATKGGQAEVYARDNCKSEIVVMLHKLGNDVTAVAAGNVTILASSGFSFTKPPTPTPPLVKPETPVLTAGVNNGEIICKTKKQRGVTNVSYMIAPVGTEPVNWKVYSSPNSKYLFTKLQSGVKYQVKIQLIGVRNQVAESEVATYIPQ